MPNKVWHSAEERLNGWIAICKWIAGSSQVSSVACKALLRKRQRDGGDYVYSKKGNGS
jgi:hypothetical protein